MMKWIKQLFCNHRFKRELYEYCGSNGKMKHIFVCEKCGKRKVM